MRRNFAPNATSLAITISNIGEMSSAINKCGNKGHPGYRCRSNTGAKNKYQLLSNHFLERDGKEINWTTNCVADCAKLTAYVTFWKLDTSLVVPLQNILYTTISLVFLRSVSWSFYRRKSMWYYWQFLLVNKILCLSMSLGISGAELQQIASA